MLLTIKWAAFYISSESSWMVKGFIQVVFHNSFVKLLDALHNLETGFCKIKKDFIFCLSLAMYRTHLNLLFLGKC